MGELAQGFVRGFASTMATDIQTRRTEARDYFNKQVEMARTTGLQNRQRVRQAVDSSVNIAKQLSQMGVPKEVVMAVANQNPEGLGDFYKEVAEISAAGGKIDKELFDSVMTVGGDFQAPDEDFGTFFSRMYEPIRDTAAADPESFNNDKRGSIFASMMGLNSMDRAREKLGETVISDGYTAEELLAYGDNPTPNKVGGDAVVTFDFERIKKLKEREANLDVTDLTRIKDVVDTQFQTSLGAVEATAGVLEGDEAKAVNAKEAGIKAFEALQNSPYASAVPPDVLLSFVNQTITAAGGEGNLTLEDLAGASESATETPSDTGTTTPPPGTETAATEAPIDPAQAAPIDPNQEPELSMLVDPENRLQLVFVKDNGDGTATYRDNSRAVALGGAAGQDYVIPNHIARQYGSK